MVGRSLLLQEEPETDALRIIAGRQKEGMAVSQTDLCKLVFCGCMMTLLTGCSLPVRPSAATTTGTTTPVSTGTTTSASQPSSTQPSYSSGVSLSRPSVIVGTNGWGPTLVYHATDDGGAAPYASLEGCLPAVDGKGNVYMLTFHFPWGCGDSQASIDVYSANSVGASPIRSLPVGPGSVKDMAVSSEGEIFVNDGNGVAVFGPTANGSDAPVRYVQWDGGGGASVTPGYIAVDGKDNLYVQNVSSIAVFGPHDTGLVTPSRVISGQHTQLVELGRMTVDAQGNLYVTTGVDTLRPVGVLEFAADANGDAAPQRYVSSTAMSNFSVSLGVAVDSSGLIYIRATYPYCGAIFVFAADASGTTTPLRVIGGDCPAYEPDGTIAVL